MNELVLRPRAPRRLRYFTPLRYPGGKGKLASYIKRLIKENKLLDGEYVEPYAGGAGLALELLFHEYVSQIHINDLSRPVHAFWKSVLNDTDALCRLIRDTRLNIGAWDRQKKIFAHQSDFDDLSLGFATFFLNRTNRSGIFNGGIIGGRNQSGPWKIDARFNKDELIFRIESIAKMRNRIKLTRLDAISFLRRRIRKWPKKTLIYLDPPYFDQGSELYYDFYRPEDHIDVSEFVASKLEGRYWIVSYDNVPQIRKLYIGYRSIVYSVGYTARERRSGKEVMFFSSQLAIPNLVGPIQQVGGIRAAA
jgi:DNA adenine methylase